MSRYECEAIVLKKFDLGEADRIITFYTKEMGKVRAVARGVRKPKSKFAGLVLPFSYNRLTIYRGRSLDRINHLESIYPFNELREDMTRMAYASYLAELVEKVGLENNPNEPLFSLFLTSLHKMINTTGERLKYIELIFNLRLLQLQGLEPGLVNCVHCSRELGVKRDNYFSIEEGGLICPDCHKGEGFISGESLQILRQILQGERLGNLQISGKALRELNGLLPDFLQYHLDLRLKSLEFLNMIKDLGVN